MIGHYALEKVSQQIKASSTKGIITSTSYMNLFVCSIKIHGVMNMVGGINNTYLIDKTKKRTINLDSLYSET